jgi:hypothetical protein
MQSSDAKCVNKQLYLKIKILGTTAMGKKEAEVGEEEVGNSYRVQVDDGFAASAIARVEPVPARGRSKFRMLILVAGPEWNARHAACTSKSTRRSRTS